MKQQTTLTTPEAVNIFYARQFAYDVLRRFFVEEPTRIYLKAFVQKNMINLFPFVEDSDGIQEGVNDIQQYFAAHDVVHNDRHYQDLHWDYTKLFIGPFELPSPPWESAYVRRDQLLFQGTTMDVRKKYEKYGIKVPDFNIEADDHIGLELDFMYHLNKFCIEICEKHQTDAYALPKLIHEQQIFLQEHLLKFTSEFCQLVIQNADTQFYAGLAKILENFLVIDSNVLNELMNIEIFPN